MMAFKISLIVLLFAFTAAEVPSYIKICGRRNPNLEQCIIDSVTALMPKLKAGIPELDVPALEPLILDEIALADLDTFRAKAYNVKFYGLSNYIIKKFKVDFDNKRFLLEHIFPKVDMYADYDVKAKILVPIHEKGPIKTITRNTYTKIVLNYKLVERKNRTLIYFNSMTTDVNIPEYEAFFRPGEKDSNALTQAINSVLETSKQEIIDSMKPHIEEAISKKILELSNRICKHFTFDELFPDRP